MKEEYKEVKSKEKKKATLLDADYVKERVK